VTTGDEQQQHQNRQQPGTFIEPAPEGTPKFFNRMTCHDAKLDTGLMNIQVYSGGRAAVPKPVGLNLTGWGQPQSASAVIRVRD